MNNKVSNKTYKICYFIFFWIFALIAGLRYNLGFDYFAYSRHFLAQSDIFNLSWGEISDSRFGTGYLLFSSIMKMLSNKPQILFFGVSLFDTLILFYVLRKVCEKRYLSFTLLTYFCSLYLLQEMQAVRQSMAAVLVYLSFYLTIKNHSKYAVITVIFASLFHASSIFVLLFIPLLGRKYSRKVRLYIITVSSFVMIFRIRWIEILTSIMSNFSGFEFADAFIRFTTSSTLNFERGIFLVYFIYLYVYIYLLYRSDNLFITNKTYRVFSNAFLFFLVITSSLWEINYFSTRLGWFFLIGFCFVLPYIFDYLKMRTISLLLILALNFNYVRHFIFPDDTTLPFAPYEDYISCTYFGVPSTGYQRASSVAGEGFYGYE